MARIFITGASTGLGLLTATSLAEDGHEVVLHARNADRLEDPSVLSKMHSAVYGDLAHLDAIHRIAEELEVYGSFDAVIHNAGLIDGDDLVAVNVVAPYALTALMPRPARLILLSSSMHLGGSPRHLAKGLVGSGKVSYSDTKLWATALTMGIAKLWPDVLAHAVCPGWVPTRMGGPSASDDLTEGHRTQEWLATAPEAEIRPRSGGYWHHHTTQRPHRATLDPIFQHELLTELEKHTGISLPE